MLRQFIKHFIWFNLSLLLAFSLAAKADSVNNLFRQAGDPVVGNPNGKITVVEFFDYQCSHCANMAAVMPLILRANPDVRIVYKEFPIRGPVSEFAARAALAANKQGKYAEFNHALLSTSLSLTDSTILDIAKSSGLNMAKLKKDMDSSSISRKLNENMQLAQRKHVTGTPAFFIGKTNAPNDEDVNFVLGEMSYNELQDAIDKAKK
jgi:protein-disulfide isomerase